MIKKYLVAALAAFGPAVAFAGGGGVGNSGEALNQASDVMSQAINLGLTAIGALLFLAAVASILFKLWQAGTGKASWGEVFIPVVVGAVVVFFAGWLIAEGQTAAEAIGTGGDGG